MAEWPQSQAEELVQVTAKIAESAAGVKERIGERFEQVGDQVCELVNANKDGATLMAKQLGKVVEDQAAQNLELNGAIRTAHDAAQQANMATTGQVQQLTTSIQLLLEGQMQKIKKGKRLEYAGDGEEWCSLLASLTGPHLGGLQSMVVGIVGQVCVSQLQLASQLEALIAHCLAFGLLLFRT